MASILATAATVIATAIINRRRGKSDFLGEVLRENEYLRGKNHSLTKENGDLNEQNRMLGKENVVLLRSEHAELVENLEKLARRFERIAGVTEGGK